MKKINLIPCFFVLTGFEALAAAIWLALIPAEAGNSVAFGFSFQRLIMITGMTLTAVLNLCIWVWQNKLPRLESFMDNRWTKLAGIAVTVSAWVLVWLPAYQWGRFGGYRDRLLPILVWLLVTGLQFCVVMLFRSQKSRPLKDILLEDHPVIKAWGIALTVITLVVVIVAVFRIGFIPDIVYWNDVNVPLLGWQILAVVMASLMVTGLLSRTGFFTDERITCIRALLPDIVICLFIWGLAVTTWTRIDMPHSYFSPGPYPPNNEMYPFSDAATYDRAAQLAVIGEGVGTQYGQYVDKPFYVGFLAVIHLLVGSRMDPVIGAQVAVFALMPVLLYLTGRKLHSRLAGVMTAGLLIFREMNNIQGTLWVLSTNSRVLMSESLVTLLLALFVFLLLSWFKDRNKTLYLIGSAGALGLAGMVRLNPFLLAPVTILAILLVTGKAWKKGLSSALVFAAVFTLTLLPYMLQSYDRHGKLLFFQSTLSGVVMNQRAFYALNAPPPETAATPEAQSTPAPTVTTPEVEEPVNETWNKITGVSRYASAHFFHNLVDGAAIFPTGLTLESLEKTVKAPNSFWSAESNGELTAGQFIMVFLALTVIALGAAAGWSRSGWAGLVPAGFMATYSLATAAARTSGGRYFIPADWVFLLYYAFGLAQLSIWLSAWLKVSKVDPVINLVESVPVKKVLVWKPIALTLAFMVAGSVPVILDRAIPPKYTQLQKYELRSQWKQDWMLKSLELTEQQWDSFIAQPASFVFKGRALYPRYYAQGQGEPDRFSAGRAQNFPRLVLEVIGPAGVEGMVSGVLPLEKMPDSLPNGADVTVLGCRGELNDDLFAVIIEGQDGGILHRSPGTSWTCPVILPVCDDNRVCR